MVPRMAVTHVAARPSAMPIAVAAAIFNARRMFLPGPFFADYAGVPAFCQPVCRPGLRLPAVSAGRGARLAMTLRALVGIAAIHRGVLGVRIGTAARGKGQLPTPPPVTSDEGR